MRNPDSSVSVARPGSRVAAAVAAVISAATASAIAAVLAITLLADHLVSLRLAEAERLPGADGGASTGLSVDRRGRTDPMPPASGEPRTPRQIRSVEVIGIRNTAIVYRDASGDLLYRSDPVANVTVVAKDVVLPEVTIRDSAATPVERVELNLAPGLLLTAGCEYDLGASAHGTVAAVQTSRRCLAARDERPQRAAGNRN